MRDMLYGTLLRARNAARCFNTLEAIWNNDRLFSSDAFARTAAYCAARMEEAGLSQMESLALAADGHTPQGDWIIPQAWDARRASLRIVSPESPEPLLARYPEVPCSLVMYSAATPPEGVCGELLHVRDPQALIGKDLREKILMTRDAPAQSLVDCALSGGALGIVTAHFPLYPGTRDSLADVYEAHRWDNTFCVPRNESGLFAFSLSPRQADLLEGLLARGTVMLHACVDASAYDGSATTVSGLLPGETEREIIGYGHIYEPGAEDNASGCAALIEAAWMLREAIDTGALPRPRRGIRIAMGFECGGSMGYLAAHPERIGKTDAGLVADMVGTEGVDRTKLSIWHNPWANYGCVDRLIIELVETIAAKEERHFPYREVGFAVGTDNILSDPCFRMPTVSLIAEPALSYHSSMDTPERIERDVLARSALLCAMYLYEAANAPQDAFEPDPAPQLAPLGEDCRIPTRRLSGCLTLEGGERVRQMTAQERARWQPAWNTELNMPLFWMNGRRTVAEITALTAAELSHANPDRYAAELSDYVSFLAKYGYITL